MSKLINSVRAIAGFAVLGLAVVLAGCDSAPPKPPTPKTDTKPATPEAKPGDAKPADPKPADQADPEAGSETKSKAGGGAN
ncbi:MAG: hypothetical protein IT428_02265 [Planctomycetaceae bacterium]|nr:hypothetical protein [Planctomycetaceae bacterium]